MENFKAYSELLIILDKMQESRENGHPTRAKDCDRTGALDESMTDSLDALMFPIKNQIEEALSDLRYEQPLLLQDATNGTYKGNDESYYEKLRQNGLDEIFSQKDDLLALESIFSTSEIIQKAAKQIAYTKAFRGYCSKAVASTIAINLMRFGQHSLTEIKQIVPWLTMNDLYTLSDEQGIRFSVSAEEREQIAREKQNGIMGIESQIRNELRKKSDDVYPCVLTLTLCVKDGWDYAEEDSVKLYFQDRDACENWLTRNGFALGRYEWLDEDFERWTHYSSDNRQYIDVDIAEFEFDDELTKAPEWAR